MILILDNFNDILQFLVLEEIMKLSEIKNGVKNDKNTLIFFYFILNRNNVFKEIENLRKFIAFLNIIFLAISSSSIIKGFYPLYQKK